MLLIEFQWWRSQHGRQIVAGLKPGTPFSAVVQQLGSPIQNHTNAEAVALYGTRKDPSIITNSVLYMFEHRPPMRRILVYTDRGSRTLTYADWREHVGGRTSGLERTRDSASCHLFRLSAPRHCVRQDPNDATFPNILRAPTGTVGM